MTWSLGEVEALARKAARGAGYDWGLAEEIGRAVRWLSGRGGPAADLLAEYLCDVQPAASCPFAVGAALVDLSGGIRPGTEVELGPVAAPVFLLPFVADLGGGRVSRGDVTLATQDDLSVVNWPESWIWSQSAVVVRFLGVPATPPRPLTHRATLSHAGLATLTTLAGRTYAPPTEASRVSGAGAGLADND